MSQMFRIADGTVLNTDDQSSIASNSTKYANSTCNVCVSQNLPDPISLTTNGTINDYNITVRDGANHDMGAINATLAAFGVELGGRKSNITIASGGKPFHLWPMIVPESSARAVIFLDYGGPGPVNLSRVPPM